MSRLEGARKLLVDSGFDRHGRRDKCAHGAMQHTPKWHECKLTKFSPSNHHLLAVCRIDRCTAHAAGRLAHAETLEADGLHGNEAGGVFWLKATKLVHG